jgi:hypothetical protein
MKIEAIARYVIMDPNGVSNNGNIFIPGFVHEAVKAGLFEGKPCFLLHDSQRPGYKDRLRIGYWHDVEFNLDTMLVEASLHAHSWDDGYANFGASVDATWPAIVGKHSSEFKHTEALEGLETKYDKLVLRGRPERINSIDLVWEPSMPACRMLYVLPTGETNGDEPVIECIEEITESGCGRVLSLGCG